MCKRGIQIMPLQVYPKQFPVRLFKSVKKLAKFQNFDVDVIAI